MQVSKNITTNSTLKTIFTIGIVLVWFVNGFFCKLLNLVPRHQQIVTQIITQVLGEEFVGFISWAGFLTKLIGFSEILMVVWILSRIKSRWCAMTQIFIVLLMNIIEFSLVPELLLFGKTNIIIAVIFVSVVFVNEFVMEVHSSEGK
jgi:hypothetical protein